MSDEFSAMVSTNSKSIDPPSTTIISTQTSNSSTLSIPLSYESIHTSLPDSEPYGTSMFSEPLSSIPFNDSSYINGTIEDATQHSSLSFNNVLLENKQAKPPIEMEERWIEPTEEGEVMNEFSCVFSQVVSPIPNQTLPQFKPKYTPSASSMKQKKKSNKKRKRSLKSNDADDIWDDTVVLETWNKGLEKYRRQQRGVPISDSEVEEEEENEEKENLIEEVIEDVSEQVHVNGTSTTINNTSPSILHSLPMTKPLTMSLEDIPRPSSLPSSLPPISNFSDHELFEKITTSWYWVGYYMGIYDERKRASSSSNSL